MYLYMLPSLDRRRLLGFLKLPKDGVRIQVLTQDEELLVQLDGLKRFSFAFCYKLGSDGVDTYIQARLVNSDEVELVNRHTEQPSVDKGLYIVSVLLCRVRERT